MCIENAFEHTNMDWVDEYVVFYWVDPEGELRDMHLVVPEDEVGRMIKKLIANTDEIARVEEIYEDVLTA
jgi:hypothetical protein